MGFRFRKSVKLLPGVRVNLSTRGVSTTIGGPGASVNLSKRGVRSTVGIPGTGLSYTSSSSRTQDAPQAAPRAPATTAEKLLGSVLLGCIAAGLLYVVLPLSVQGAAPLFGIALAIWSAVRS